MTLRWIEGFEALQTQTAITDDYANVTWASGTSFVAGTLQGTAIQAASSGSETVFETPDLGLSDDEWIVGCRINVDEVAINQVKKIFSLYSGTTLIGYLAWQTGNPNTGFYALRWYRNTGAGLTLGSNLAIDVHRYVECRVLIKNTAVGEIEIKVNGSTYQSLTSQITTGVAGTPTADRVRFHLSHSGNASSKYILDDVYVLDTAGGSRAAFLGNQVVEGILPSADGDLSDWTALGGSDHYLEVDETTEPDEDTSYVEASVDNDQELFEYENLSFLAGTINGVMVRSRLKNDAAGSRDVEVLHKSSDANLSNGTTKTVSSTSYATVAQVWERDPDGPTDWTPTRVNGSQFGMELIP